MMRLVILVVTAAVTIVAGASATPTSSLSLGVFGNASVFEQQTGQRSEIRHTIIRWGQGLEWGTRLPVLLEQLRPVPLLGIGTGPTGTKGVIAPLEIAQGKGDAFLIAVNRAIDGFGDLVYLRPLPEMNNHHRPFSAFDESGRTRGAMYSTEAFRKAFARIYLLVHGGSARTLSARLRKLGLPGVTQDLPKTPVRVVWNPQGLGSPNLAENSAQSYYPGDEYVDVVANDLYQQRSGAAWEANEQLYDDHPGKPFGIAEWGLWSVDDPAFVERMAAFAETHRRVLFLVYFTGKRGSPWDLATKPKSRGAYRRSIAPSG